METILIILLALTCISGYITHHIVEDHFNYFKWLEITIGLIVLSLFTVLYLILKI